MCVDHYVDLLIERILSKLLRQPIDILVYCANVITKNILQILISLCLCLSTYGWFSHAEQMIQCIQDIYHEIKQTTSAAAHEFWTIANTAIVTLWTSLSVIKAVQFAFLLLLLIAVPDCIDYFNIIRLIDISVRFLSSEVIERMQQLNRRLISFCRWRRSTSKDSPTWIDHLRQDLNDRRHVQRKPRKMWRSTSFSK